MNIETKKLTDANRALRVETAARLAQNLIIDVLGGGDNFDLPADYAKTVRELVRMLLDSELYAAKSDHLAVQGLFLNEIKNSLKPQPAKALN